MPILIFIHNSSVISRNKSGDERKLLTIFNQFYINVKEACDLSRHPVIGRGHPQRECSSIC